jgi:hypothetical protein
VWLDTSLGFKGRGAYISLALSWLYRVLYEVFLMFQILFLSPSSGTGVDIRSGASLHIVALKVPCTVLSRVEFCMK